MNLGEKCQNKFSRWITRNQPLAHREVIFKYHFQYLIIVSTTVIEQSLSIHY